MHIAVLKCSSLRICTFVQNTSSKWKLACLTIERVEVGGYLQKLLHFYIYFYFHFYFYTSKWRHILQLREWKWVCCLQKLCGSVSTAAASATPIYIENNFSQATPTKCPKCSSHEMPIILLSKNSQNHPPTKCSLEPARERTQNAEKDRIRDVLQDKIFEAFHQLLLLQLFFILKQLFRLKWPSSALLSRTLFEQVMLLCVSLKVQLLSGFCLFLLFHIQLRQSHHKVLLLLRRKAS